MTHGMTVTIKGRTLCPHRHKGVGVGEQAYFIALLTQLLQDVEVALWHMVHIAVPGVIALLHGNLASYQSAHLLSELLFVDASRLQVGKHTPLLKGIQSLAGICESHLLERPDGALETQRQYHAPQVEGYIFDVVHVCLVFACKDTKILLIIQRFGSQGDSPRVIF